MTMTASDIISMLNESGEDLSMLEYTIVKHWNGDKFDEKIYFQNFEQFVDCVFDLDIHGWELSGFGKSKYPRCSDSYPLFVGGVCAEFTAPMGIEGYPKDIRNRPKVY